jgi:hypothetical protein
VTHAPRAERRKTMSNENPFGETIYSYSRAQAIEDGVLVDLSQVDSIRHAWKHPFACTSAVWAIIEEALKQPGQDVAGICHDISFMAMIAIRKSSDAQIIHFRVIITETTHALKLHIGPGDSAAPVLTLMLPHED